MGFPDATWRYINASRDASSSWTSQRRRRPARSPDGEILIPGNRVCLRKAPVPSSPPSEPGESTRNPVRDCRRDFLARHLDGRARGFSATVFLFLDPGDDRLSGLAPLATQGRSPASVDGLVLTCLGDFGHFHYKQSRRGTAGIDPRRGSGVEGARRKAHGAVPQPLWL